MRLTSKLLDLTGVGAQRLRLAWVSSAEARRFTEVVTEVTETLQQAGPVDRETYKSPLTAAVMTLESENIRWLVGKESSITTKGDVYQRQWNENEYEKQLDHILEREYQKNLIFMALQQGAASVRDISKVIGLDLLRVSYLLADLEHTGRAEFSGMENGKPQFAVI